MVIFLAWYLALSLIGWLAFPLAYRLLPALADRGYALARTLGLLLWAYIFWLLASLGLLTNHVPSYLLSAFLVLLLSAWALGSGRAAELRVWMNANWKQIVVTELVFFTAFTFMTLVRAANPEILGTEKPMELAFINAILGSPVFPPHDPWLSGYAISYYYFGYVMVAMLAALTGVAGSVAFNMGVVMVFALSATGAYGLLYSLLQARGRAVEGGPAVHPISGSRTLALLAPVFVLLVSNLVGLLEVLHARGIFWATAPDGSKVSAFWSWLDLRELSQPPAETLSWTPGRYLWWWRASRVIQDYDLQENWKEIIDEFPAFSYILADLHPHVLAMPFAFLAMALAWNIFQQASTGSLSSKVTDLWRKVLLSTGLALLGLGAAAIVLGLAASSARAGLLGLLVLIIGLLLLFTLPLRSLRIEELRRWFEPLNDADTQEPLLQISLPSFLLAAVALGGMAFLNIWDFPFYLFLFTVAYLLGRRLGSPFQLGLFIKEFLRMIITLGLAGVVLYLPYYVGFSSQASGILPNLIYPSRGVHLWVMFATLWLPILGFIAWLGKSLLGGRHLRVGFSFALILFLVLWLLSLFLAAGISLLPERGAQFLGAMAAPDLASLLAGAFLRRFQAISGWLWLLVFFGMIVSLMSVPWKEYSTVAARKLQTADLFTLLLALVALLLVVGPEFFYLLDLFGWRMNTIFKFYYQAWLLWAITAAYGSVVLLSELRRSSAWCFRFGLAIVLFSGLLYPVFGFWERTSGFSPASGWTLDGTAYMNRNAPQEMAAVQWLSDASPGVVAEAVGGSYSEYGRISMHTGHPTVLGWDFHEMQWRGSNEAQGTRKADIQELYCTRDDQLARQILDQYNIRYVYIGNLERSTYSSDVCPGGVNEAKFTKLLVPVFRNEQVVIYAAP